MLWKRALFALFLLFYLFATNSLEAQLGFCPGDTGEAIFSENFGSGTTNGPALPNGFTTYTYVDQSPQDGFYTISNNLSQLQSWHNAPDHTPNDTNGKAFIVNASFTADEFFRSTITNLCENTFYEFSAWVINLYDSDFTNCANGGIPVNIRFEIWNESDTVLLTAGDTGDINGSPEPIWEQYGLIFETTNGQESVLLKMINNGDGGCGNDLAIDDIEFRACGDTTFITTPDNEQSILICEEQSPLSTTLVAIIDFDINSDYVIQWQSSTDLVNWVNIPGATQETYTPDSITQSTYFRVNFAVDSVNLGSPFCSFVSEPFFIEIAMIPDPPLSNGNVFSCSEDPIPALTVTVQQGETVNWYDAPSGGTLLASNTTSFTPISEGTFYAEAIVQGIDCISNARTEITLSIFPSISFNQPVEEITICEGEDLQLLVEIPNVNYNWSTGETTQSISISEAGSYTVTATTNQNCSAQKTFIISSTIVPEIIPITVNVGENYTIETTNEGDFEYSANGIIYQDSPNLLRLPSGIITVFVRNVNGCPPSTMTFYNIAVPTYFTPNNDGINDLFTLPDLSFFESSELKIFDRFGKLLFVDSGPSMSWDGTFNGAVLPVDDYWYTLTLDTTSLTGNISLLLL